MKNLGYIAGEITKGKNLSENLLKYGNGMCSMYNGLGFIKMSMNYYTVLDIARDLQNDKDLLNMINRLNELVERFVENDECDDYEAFNELNSFREQIIEIMEVITAYVDRLRIYEHVLNRVEYRFNEGELDYDYYNTYMTMRLERLPRLSGLLLNLTGQNLLSVIYVIFITIIMIPLQWQRL